MWKTSSKYTADMMEITTIYVNVHETHLKDLNLILPSFNLIIFGC